MINFDDNIHMELTHFIHEFIAMHRDVKQRKANNEKNCLGHDEKKNWNERHLTEY